MTNEKGAAGDADDLVLWDLDDQGVLTLALNRPERRNGWNPAMEARYFARLDEASNDVRVRAIVVTGAGRAFCPGMDMQRLDAVAGKPLDLSGRRPFYRPLSVPKPMIAAINGGCAGVGLLQALMCDIRFAARGARFATSFARRGLPAERGISWLLPRLIGPERAYDLLLSGRTFDADEALSLGVVSRLSEPGEVLAGAQAYARDLARNCSPLAMAVIRDQVRADLDTDFVTAYDRSIRAMGALAEQADFREGIAGFVEGRPPAFEPLPENFDTRVYLDKPQSPAGK